MSAPDYSWLDTVTPVLFGNWHGHLKEKKRKKNRIAGEGELKTRLAKYRPLICFYCEKPLIRLEATRDHLIPVKHGGGTTILNQVFACELCNLEKGGRMPTKKELKKAESWFLPGVEIKTCGSLAMC